MSKTRVDGEGRAFAESRVAAEAAVNEGEQFRRLAEEAREVRDHHYEALEAIRQDREQKKCGGLFARYGT